MGIWIFYSSLLKVRKESGFLCLQSYTIYLFIVLRLYFLDRILENRALPNHACIVTAEV